MTAVPKYASDHIRVDEIVSRLKWELPDAYNFSPGWHDRKAECLELVIEGPDTISPDRLNHLAGDLMPHGILLYDAADEDTYSWTKLLIQV